MICQSIILIQLINLRVSCDQMIIKLTFCNQIHLFNSQIHQLTYQILADFTRKVFSNVKLPNKFHYIYLDHEGDELTINSEDDVLNFMELVAIKMQDQKAMINDLPRRYQTIKVQIVDSEREVISGGDSIVCFQQSEESEQHYQQILHEKSFSNTSSCGILLLEPQALEQVQSIKSILSSEENQEIHSLLDSFQIYQDSLELINPQSEQEFTIQNDHIPKESQDLSLQQIVKNYLEQTNRQIIERLLSEEKQVISFQVEQYLQTIIQQIQHQEDDRHKKELEDQERNSFRKLFKINLFEVQPISNISPVQEEESLNQLVQAKIQLLLPFFIEKIIQSVRNKIQSEGQSCVNCLKEQLAFERENNRILMTNLLEKQTY